MSKSVQFVDHEVTRKKFEEEVQMLESLRESYRKRGILIADVAFPDIFLAFCPINLRPYSIAFAVRINFENYDFAPPSVTFINPFSFQPLTTIAEVGITFMRRIENSPIPHELLQQNAGKLPFLCIPGVREYHEHPAHSGDSWFLHRGKGSEGSLGFIVEKLYEYGVLAIQHLNIQLSLNVSGFVFDRNKVPT